MIRPLIAVATVVMGDEMTTDTAALEDAAEAIQLASAAIHDVQSRLAKQAGISLPQYSVLRILHESGEALSCSEIAQCMIARDPDITRLVGKLHGQGLVSRERCGNDRRVIRASLTDAGRALVAPLHERMSRARAEILRDFDRDQLAELSGRLRRLGQSKPR